jgi:subtilisin-like proprotein convertase family protein
MLTNKYVQSAAIALGLAFTLSMPADALTTSFSTGAIADATPTDTSITDFTTSVSGLDPSTSLVTVSLNLSHDDLEDLEIYLTAPTGEILNLATFLSGAPGTVNTTLSDSSSNFAIDTDSNPYDLLSYQPSASSLTFALSQTILSFAGFNGSDPNGTWTLRIADLNNNGLTGTLTTATLDVQAVPFEFSPVTGLICLGALGLYTQWRKRK